MNGKVLGFKLFLQTRKWHAVSEGALATIPDSPGAGALAPGLPRARGAAEKGRQVGVESPPGRCGAHSARERKLTFRLAYSLAVMSLLFKQPPPEEPISSVIGREPTGHLVSGGEEGR